MSVRVSTLALVLWAAAACTGAAPDEGGASSPPDDGLDPRAATEIRVTLRTAGSGHYLCAEDGGGGLVNANRPSAQGWETFTLLDRNEGALSSGDTVFLRSENGRYLMAQNGGGGALDASSSNQLDWEIFRVVKVNGSGQIQNGDQIGLQTLLSGQWVSAQNGGGAGVRADGPTLSGWEAFVVGFAGAGPPPPAPGGWNLVWQDEFDGNGLDESKWTYEVKGPGWVNNERQNYTYRRWENVRVEGGNLVIEGRRDWFNGHEYSSGRIKTAGKRSWTYGRFEARMQLPGGWGTWPAFWMMPDNQSRGWPACGEIDVMEEVGYDQDRVHSTTHSLRYNWKAAQQRTASIVRGGLTSGFHTYAVEWYPDHIDAFVDGVKYFTSWNDGGGDDSWPFNKNFHLILNLAIGGDWGGAQGIDPNAFPRKFLVDYVRVYQR
jgi:beta-glucanase (GH16 family)